ncbi:unnamed protein product [Sphagnum jensenii]|uniref:Transglycosylase SLT domain-containing protein n=1 Tax=Sphagnum jensenii TaxID=128206 RepID=A0ABP0V7K1_9BRYO
MRGGMLLLQQLLQHYNGNLDYALAAYNSNPTYVDSTIKAGRQFAPDIQKYVQAVERTYMRDNSGATVNNVVNVGGVTVNGTNLTGEQIGKHVAAKIQQYNSNQTKRQLQELSTIAP